MFNNKKLAFSLAGMLLVALFLSGCGLLGGEQKKKIDPPQEASYVDDGETEIAEEPGGTETGEEEAEQGTVETELYLIDKNGYVVSQTMELPKSEGIAKQALDYLVENGPVTEMLPNGFRAVLPADTQMTVDIKEGVATIDFSKEFANYQPEDEQRILQSVTWTMTQFDSVDKVKLQLNGSELKSMPVNGTPIGKQLSRSNGINYDVNDVVDISNTKAVTVYYLGGSEENYYYVPVTKRVEQSAGKSEIESIVSALAAGPGYANGLLSDFQSNVKLTAEPKIKEGQVTLDFNDAIYSSFEEKVVSGHTLNSLVLSLTEQPGIESVAVTVNGSADLVTESGEKLSEPVSRPEKVNTGSY